MAGRKSDFTLTKLDDLFTTQAQRDEEQLSKIRDIPLELIDDFPDHPFKVRDDEDMMQLVESVKERGVITPATVRQKEDGRYELVSGHRRKRACELAGFETLRSEIVDLNRDEATILMVESNFQRSEILPSEKAFAYKMRLEAMKRQAGRPRKENVSPVGTNLRTDEQIAQETGDSRNQIHRYVRLTNLVPELLEFVDEGRIKMRPAVELSYLDEDCQRDVVDEIDLNDATPSHDQTIRMRKLFNEGNLTTEAIHAVMSEEKPNQKEKIVLRGDRVRQLIPKNIPVSQTEDFVCKALEHYNVAIIKHTDDGETKIETPEKGASFEIYLKSAGSYDAANKDERDTIVCDENGFGQTKDMPYGIYTVHQTSGWEPINMCRSCWARKPLIPTRSERVPEEAVIIPPTIRLAAESYLPLMRCVCSIISTLFYLSVGKDPLWISNMTL